MFAYTPPLSGIQFEWLKQKGNRILLTWVQSPLRRSISSERD